MIRKITNIDGTVRYQARVTVLGQRLFKTFETRQVAAEWTNEVRFKRDTKVPCMQKVTIDDMFCNYLENAKNKGNAPSSIKKARFLFKNHLKPFYGAYNMVNVSIKEHRTFMTYLREKKLSEGRRKYEDQKLSSAIVNRARSLMSTMFNVAITQKNFGDAFLSNPFTAIEPMKEMDNPFGYWSSEEIGQFLESEKNSRYYPLWVLMLNTGLRIGEAVAVHGEQIDRYADILTVDRIFCSATYVIRHQTKSRQLRQVGINDTLQKVLYPFITHSGPLFLMENGERLRSDYLIKKVFPKTCKRAGVKYITLHGLRHTFASHYMMNGGNLYDLQKILGHSSISTTERYAHFSRLHMKIKSNIVGFGGNVIRVNFKQQEAELRSGVL